MSVPGQDDPEEDKEVSRGTVLASLVLAALALFIGLTYVFGPRGVVLSLGIVATVLAFVSLQRAVTDSERGTAIGALVLGTGTIVLGIVVVNAG